MSSDRIEKEGAPTEHIESKTNNGLSGDGLTANVDDTDPKVAWSTVLAVFFMGLTFVPAISTSFVLPTMIIQQIGQQLHDTDNIAWIPGGWSIGSAVSFSIAGGISDIFGRRWVLLTGQVLLLVGAIICAVAQTTLNIAAGSTVVGFGAGTVFVAYPGIAELLPNKWRGIGLGWTEFCICVPWGALAGIIATQLYLRASWRWCYYITIIYAVVVLVGTFTCYFPPSRPREDYERSRWQQFKDLDFVGFFLFATGLTLLLVGITSLGASKWSVALVATTIPLGTVLFVSAFIYDFTVAKQPVFPLRLFRLFREFTVYLIILFICGMVWQVMVSLGNQGTLFMFTNDVVEIGYVSTASNLGGLIGGWILPSLVHKIKHIKIQFIVALVIQTVFTAAYATVIPNNKLAWTIMPMFGQSCFTWLTTLSYVSSSLLVPQEDLGVSAGLIGTFRSAGNSIGNAVFTTIMTSIVNRDLANNIVGAAIGAGMPPSPDNIGALIPAVIENAVGVPGALADLPPVITSQPAILAAAAGAFRDTYASAFKMMFYSTIPFGVLALVAALFIYDASYLLNNHVAVHQEKYVLGNKDAAKEGKVMD